jgi:preprotein translocase subunit SecE
MTNEQTNPVNEKPKSGISDFIRETQRETAKVTWPTRKEISMTTTLIVLFALVTGIFFLLVDTGLGYVVSQLLGMHS